MGGWGAGSGGCGRGEGKGEGNGNFSREVRIAIAQQKEIAAQRAVSHAEMQFFGGSILELATSQLLPQHGSAEKDVSDRAAESCHL